MKSKSVFSILLNYINRIFILAYKKAYKLNSITRSLLTVAKQGKTPKFSGLASLAHSSLYM